MNKEIIQQNNNEILERKRQEKISAMIEAAKVQVHCQVIEALVRLDTLYQNIIGGNN